jgi:hypothetical protein
MNSLRSLDIFSSLGCPATTVSADPQQSLAVAFRDVPWIAERQALRWAFSPHVARSICAGADARAFHKAEIEKWWPIIKAATIKAE